MPFLCISFTISQFTVLKSNLFVVIFCYYCCLRLTLLLVVPYLLLLFFFCCCFSFVVVFLLLLFFFCFCVCFVFVFLLFLPFSVHLLHHLPLSSLRVKSLCGHELHLEKTFPTDLKNDLGRSTSATKKKSDLLAIKICIKINTKPVTLLLFLPPSTKSLPPQPTTVGCTLVEVKIVRI